MYVTEPESRKQRSRSPRATVTGYERSKTNDPCDCTSAATRVVYIYAVMLSYHFEGAAGGVTSILGGVVALNLGRAEGEVTALGSDRFKLYLMASAW